MAHSTMEAYEYVRHLDHAGKFADSPGKKKQKAAMTLLRDEIPKRDLKSSDRSVDASLRRFCFKWVMRHALLAPG